MRGRKQNGGGTGLLRKLASIGAGLIMLCASRAVAADEPQKWTGPFGGTFTATFAVVSDYSFGGISQTQRQPAIQPSFGYETPTVSDKVLLSAYVGAWGSNVNFTVTGPTVEIDLMSGLRLKAFDKKLSFDLGVIHYNYLSTPADLFYDYTDLALLVSYDFGFAEINGKVRYSGNSFGNSGIAWNKRIQYNVPLRFIRLHENVSLKTYGTLGNQWVERNLNYGIPNNDYWYWQFGVIANVYGVDLSLSYVDTNIDIAGCSNTLNCQGRIIFGVWKNF